MDTEIDMSSCAECAEGLQLVHTVRISWVCPKHGVVTIPLERGAPHAETYASNRNGLLGVYRHDLDEIEPICH